MPRQKRIYNRRIKKIMQKDAQVGRIAMAVPVIISQALEIFLKCLLTKSSLITQSKRSSVLSVSHIKQCIESEGLFDFLRGLAEQAITAEGQSDSSGMSVWQLFRSKMQESSVKKKAEAVEMAPQLCLHSLDNDSSSSESELYICC
ncbi:dr1-associated corepressor isoform X2 [Nelusetta ayraudi]|uniref:dr1-associated corepressor isoform X2 n=1 Tax=Nelusetta ayraudi TaxID=303726 RepID=UPI003F6F4A52